MIRFLDFGVSSLQDIEEDIEDYIGNETDEEQKAEYEEEYEEALNADNVWVALVNSGVFHDAIGKLIECNEDWGYAVYTIDY